MANNISITRKLLFGIFALLIFIVFYLFPNNIIYWLIIAISILVLLKIKLKYYHPITGFSVPWLVVSFLTILPISHYFRNINDLTLFLITVPIVIPILLFFYSYNRKSFRIFYNLDFTRIYTIRYLSVFLVAFVLFLINAIYSGYLPLIKGILTGNTGYLSYGIHGLNGLFYALANALAIYSFYIFLHFHKKLYIYVYLTLVVIFFLCMTRQNIVSVFIESMIVYTYVKRPLKSRTVVIFGLTALLLFGIVGKIRTGRIKTVVGIKESYNWLPSSFVWVYAYGYFNVLNLDNLIESGYYGYYNGSSLIRLIPSNLRPEPHIKPSPLEISNFNVSSYLKPIVTDIGIWGSVIFTLLAMIITIKYYRAANTIPNWQNVGIYSVLYFCAFFSFFVNFWFFLPIIFQVPFMIIFNRFLLKENWLAKERITG